MALCSQKRKRAFRVLILSPGLEFYLLFIYLVCMFFIFNIKRGTLNGRDLAQHNVYASPYHLREDVIQYFNKSRVEGIGSIDGIYDFISDLQTKKLWVGAGQRTPYWPIGSTKMTQYRVKTSIFCKHLHDTRDYHTEIFESLVQEVKRTVFGITIDVEEADRKQIEKEYEKLNNTIAAQKNEDKEIFAKLTGNGRRFLDRKPPAEQEKPKNEDPLTKQFKELCELQCKKSKSNLYPLEKGASDTKQMCVKNCTEKQFKKHDDLIQLRDQFSQECNPSFIAQKNEDGYSPEKGAMDQDPNAKNKTFSRPFNFTIQSSADCISPKCEEYEYSKKILNKGFVGSHAIYPAGTGFHVDFNSDDEETLRKVKILKKNRWINQDTRAIQVQWSVLVSWTKTIYTFQANFELPGNGVMQFNHLDIQNLFLYHNLHAAEDPNQQKFLNNLQTWDLILHTIIMLHNFIYFGKIFLELSLSINRVTNFLEIINLCMLFVIVITKYIEIVVKQNLNIQLTDSDQFYDLSTVVYLQELHGEFLTLCAFFFPFRLIQFLAYRDFFYPATTILNTLARTAPGMLQFLICCVIMMLGWAQGLHISLSTMLPEFNSFWITLYTMMVSDLHVIETYHYLKDGRNIDSAIFQISKMFLEIFKFVMIVIGTSILTNLYRLAMIFEKGHNLVDPNKEAFRATIDDIEQKIEEIFKLQVDSTKSKVEIKNQKIIAWLLNRNKDSQSHDRQAFFAKLNQELQMEQNMYSDLKFNENASTNQNINHSSVDPSDIKIIEEYEAENDDSDLEETYKGQSSYKDNSEHQANNQNTSSQKGLFVQPIEFETTYWLTQFLASLFQLKPPLKTSITYDKFRIVIEFFSGGQGEKKFDLTVVEEVVEYLNYVGCKVPVLIYSDIKLSKTLYQKVMQFKKKYLMLFFTNEINEVKKFCKMEHMRQRYKKS